MTVSARTLDGECGLSGCLLTVEGVGSWIVQRTVKDAEVVHTVLIFYLVPCNGLAGLVQLTTEGRRLRLHDSLVIQTADYLDGKFCTKQQSSILIG